MKLCKDCDHARPFKTFPVIGPSDFSIARCVSQNAPQNPTDGSRNPFCSSMRISGCGQSGKWWTPRRPFWLRVVQAGAAQ